MSATERLPVLVGESPKVMPGDIILFDQWVGFVKWFWSKVDKSGGPDSCWPWTGHRRPDGYGIVQRLMGFRAHRLAWMLVNGPVSNGMDMLHSCDNPPCCNPLHLAPGTKSENMKQAYARGRHPGNGGCKPRAKITQEQAREIQARRGENRLALAQEFGLSVSGIDKVRSGVSWPVTPSQ